MFKPREFTIHRTIEHFCAGTLSVSLESEASYLSLLYLFSEAFGQNRRYSLAHLLQEGMGTAQPEEAAQLREGLLLFPRPALHPSQSLHHLFALQSSGVS